MTSASQAGNSLSFSYDALSRNLTQVGPQGTVASQWDVAGRRTKLTYPGTGLHVDYNYLVTGEMVKLRENGATSGVGVLATLAYDDLGRRTSLTRGNGTVTSYAYDPVSRLATLAEDMAGTTNDQSSSFSYSPASQIGSVTRTNDNYAWTGHGNGSTASVANGLNQLTSIGGSATAHDARGNVTSDPTSGKTYGYSSENLLTSVSGGVGLAYDPMMRLQQLTAAATTRFGYDGTALIAEYDGANAVTKRYVHGPGVDEPLVEYDGSGTSTKRWLHADERGSVIAQSDASGNVTQINRYDEYGKPQITNVGRFQYTGQAWLSEVGAYYYKARFYSPGMGGRFLQTDRIGSLGGINLYAYVGNDPVNSVDPQGLYCWPSRLTDCAGRQLDGPGGNAQPVASSGESSSGSSSSSGQQNGGLTGGPYGGSAECPNCILASDPNAAASIVYYGGYYEGNNWIDLGGQIDFFSLSSPNERMLSGFDDSFACLGASGEVGGAGLCRADRSGNVYLQLTAGPSAPFSATYGITPNADAYLSGFSISGNGLPGGGISFDRNGIGGIAVQGGAPGFGLSYGINLSEGFRFGYTRFTNFLDVFARGFVSQNYPSIEGGR